MTRKKMTEVLAEWRRRRVARRKRGCNARDERTRRTLIAWARRNAMPVNEFVNRRPGRKAA